MRQIEFATDWEFENFHYEPGDITEVEDAAAYALWQSGRAFYIDGPAPEEAPESEADEAPRRRR